jgi:HlyD family secretion protein
MRRRTPLEAIAGRPLPYLVLGAVVAAGCHGSTPSGTPLDVRPKVRLVRPQKRTITRSIGQPGFVYAYEQTAIYPKVAGFIEKWSVDIGDPIKKGQLIVEIFVPELAAEHAQKKAMVVQSEALVRVAEQAVAVARQSQSMAAAQLKEARANVGKFEASVQRWQSEVQRLTSASTENVVNPQILEESRKQLKADQAAREASKATVVAAGANEQARAADVGKAQVDVDAAKAKAQVDRAEEQRVAALLGYTRILAPYDGIVVLRNANTGDYVQPGGGDLSAARGSADESAARGAPIYVVARTDIVRIYVDVPENEADYVTAGTKAKITVPAVAGQEFDAPVTRTSWSLLPRSRTLRAEVDLTNSRGRLRPGMYAYGRVLIQRSGVRALPLACVVEVGNQNVCYLNDNGKAGRTPVQTGIDDGKWVEVQGKQENGGWTPFTGSEEVIEGDLAELSNGRRVQVIDQPAPDGG